ncbi:MAG: ABC transporter permease [Anaerolineales bacterium]|nr:ABC transporter permease [Anaerolineales bacterium]
MIQRFRENRRLQGFLLILPTLLVMVVMLIIPLTLTVVTSFGQRDADGNVIYTFTLENYWRLIGFTEQGWDDLYLRILLRSLWLALQTTVIVIAMAYPLAYFIARAPEKRRNSLLFLVLIPLWTNFIIRIYAWVMILRTQGVLNAGSVASPVCSSIPFQPLDLYPSQGPVLMGMVYEFLPFMILPIFTSLEKIEPSLYEAAADLGANAFRTFCAGSRRSRCRASSPARS